MFIGLEADYTYRSCLSLDSQLISASSHRVAFYHSAASAAAAAAAAAAADDDDVLTTLRVDVSTSHVWRLTISAAVSATWSITGKT